MKLYGMGFSRSLRCLWALEESGLDFDYQNVRLFDDGQHQESAQNPDYLGKNFAGKVPTLVDGELVISESAAILNHIARRAPHAQLMPVDDSALMARYDQVCYFVMTELEQPLWSNGKHRFALPEEYRIDDMLKTASYEFSKALGVLESYLGGREFAVGDNFSMADILIAQTLNWAERFQFDVPSKFLKLRDSHFSREAAQRALARISDC